MKVLGILIGFTLVGLMIGSLDSMLIFILSGSVPGTAIALTPQATFLLLVVVSMIAVGFYTRNRVLELAQKISQQIRSKKEAAQPTASSQPALPRRRYQEL